MTKPIHPPNIFTSSWCTGISIITGAISNGAKSFKTTKLEQHEIDMEFCLYMIDRAKNGYSIEGANSIINMLKEYYPNLKNIINFT